MNVSPCADYPGCGMAGLAPSDTIVMRSGREPGGVGGPGTPPVAPAVAKALARLEGRRHRRLPLIEPS